MTGQEKLVSLLGLLADVQLTAEKVQRPEIIAQFAAEVEERIHGFSLSPSLSSGAQLPLATSNSYLYKRNH